MPYTCTYCGSTHCGAHRLPENHDCPNRDIATPLGPELRSAGHAGRQRETLVIGGRPRGVLPTIGWCLARLDLFVRRYARTVALIVFLILATIGASMLLSVGPF